MPKLWNANKKKTKKTKKSHNGNIFFDGKKKGIQRDDLSWRFSFERNYSDTLSIGLGLVGIENSNWA